MIWDNRSQDCVETFPSNSLKLLLFDVLNLQGFVPPSCSGIWCAKTIHGPSPDNLSANKTFATIQPIWPSIYPRSIRVRTISALWGTISQPFGTIYTPFGSTKIYLAIIFGVYSLCAMSTYQLTLPTNYFALLPGTMKMFICSMFGFPRKGSARGSKFKGTAVAKLFRKFQLQRCDRVRHSKNLRRPLWALRSSLDQQ